MKGKRAQQNRAHHAEGGDVCADTECERQDRDGGKAGSLDEHAEGVAQVLKNRGHNCSSACQQPLGATLGRLVLHSAMRRNLERDVSERFYFSENDGLLIERGVRLWDYRLNSNRWSQRPLA